MKKKLLVLISAIVGIFCLTFGLTGCGLFGGRSGGNGGNGGNGGGGSSQLGTPIGNGLYVIPVSGNAYYVGGYEEEIGTSVTIPAEYDGKPITGIAEFGFHNCRNLVNIVVPEGITMIEDYAFAECFNLASLELPSSLTKIGTVAFRRCESLTSVTVPDTVTEIGENLFLDCSGLVSVTGPAEVFGQGNENMSMSYFSGYSHPNLSKIEVTKGKLFASFSSCKLTDVTIRGEVTEIGESAFMDCTQLVNLTIEEGLETIAGFVFYGCTALTELVLPEGLISIGERAFDECRGLTKVVVPSTVEYIGDNVFLDCPKVVEVTLPFLGTLRYTDSDAKLHYTFQDSPLIEKVTLTGSTDLGYQAFSYYDNLREINILGTVGHIYREAFDYCPALEKVNISDLSAWCATQFAGEDSNPSYVLGSLYLNGQPIQGDLVIPDGVVRVSDYAFCGLDEITSVKLPSSIKFIGRDAFYGTSVTRIDVETLKDWFGISFSDVLLSTADLYADGSLVEGELIVPDGVTAINSNAFYGYDKITSVTVPDGVTLIGSGAFFNCTAIAGVVLGSDVATIGSSAFYGCTALESVTLGDGVTSIGSSAFNGCTALKSVTLGGNITSIGSSAFNKCNGLRTVDYLGDVEGWLSISYGDSTSNPMNNAINLTFEGQKLRGELVIPDTIKTIPAYAFKNCTEVTSVKMGSGVTSIGQDAFSGCTAIEKLYCNNINSYLSITYSSLYSNPMYYATELYFGNTKVSGAITVPNGIEKIPAYAFSGLGELTSVTIPSSVTSIGTNAFYGTTFDRVNITDLGNWCLIDFANASANPLSVAQNLYVNNNLLSGKLTVPGTVANVGKYAFYGYDKITEVVIPKGATSIGASAFYGTNIESLTMPLITGYIGALFGASSYSSNASAVPSTLRTVVLTSGTALPNNFFRNCQNIQSVTLPNTLATIGENTFYNCTALSSISIPAGVESIGIYAFYNASGLRTVTFASNAKLSVIAAYAFSGTGITEITIPSSVTYIGNDAFTGCDNLTAVKTPNLSAWLKIEFIGIWANPLFGGSNFNSPSRDFYVGGSKVTELIIPAGVTEIKSYAFAGFKGTGVTIASSVTSIGKETFFNCDGIDSIIFLGTVEQWRAIQKESYLIYKEYTVQCDNGTLDRDGNEVN
ncbi:MAG: leucine-rich repeat domain-containing protein [Clostridiales bacterium]|nr:leucine-rich repeat domain-containing protein [Clostridiales bacterium]